MIKRVRIDDDPPNLETVLGALHKDIAGVAGGLSLMLARRAFRKESAKKWAAVLKGAASKLAEMSK